MAWDDNLDTMNMFHTHMCQLVYSQRLLPFHAMLVLQCTKRFVLKIINEIMILLHISDVCAYLRGYLVHWFLIIQYHWSVLAFFSVYTHPLLVSSDYTATVCQGYRVSEDRKMLSEKLHTYILRSHVGISLHIPLTKSIFRWVLETIRPTHISIVKK